MQIDLMSMLLEIQEAEKNRSARVKSTVRSCRTSHLLFSMIMGYALTTLLQFNFLFTEVIFNDMGLQ